MSEDEKSQEENTALFNQLQSDATAAMAKALAWQRYQAILEIQGLVLPQVAAFVGGLSPITGAALIDTLRRDLMKMRDEAYREFAVK